MAVVTFSMAGLISPWLLFWAMAAAIPFALHLLSKRRKRQRKWAAVRLLESVVQQQARRIQLEQLVLLAIRVAIPLVLALAISRPFLTSDSEDESESKRQSRLNIFIVDTSYSMGYTGEQASLLDDAQAFAADLISRAPTGDGFAVIRLQDPVTASAITFDPKAAIDEVQRLNLTFGGVDVPNALGLARNLSSQRNKQLLAGDTQVWFLSDFGVDGWRDAASVSVAWNNLSQECNVSRRAFLPTQQDNWAITALRPSSSHAVSGRATNAIARIQRFGDQAEQGTTTVTLNVDGISVLSKTVKLNCGESEMLNLPLPVLEQGQHVVEAQLSQDRLLADNRQSMVVQSKANLGVLLVGKVNKEVLPLKFALESVDASYKISRLSSLENANRHDEQLATADTVILCDVPELSKQVSGRLAEYVEDGGGLIMMHGPGADLDSWNAHASDFFKYRLISPSPLGDYQIDPLGYQTELTKPFRGFPDSGLATTPIFRYWEIENVGDTSNILAQESLLKTIGGGLLAFRSRIGLGHVVTLLSAPELGDATSGESWNAMASWPSFVPLLEAMVVDSMSGRQRSSCDVNAVFRASIPLAGEPARIEVLRPDGSRDVEVVARNADEAAVGSLGYSRTDLPGSYQVQCSDLGLDRLFCVQFEAAESQMRSVVMSQLPVSAVDTDEGQDTRSEQTATLGQDDFGLSLIWLLGALLVTESGLACFFGRRLR